MWYLCLIITTNAPLPDPNIVQREEFKLTLMNGGLDGFFNIARVEYISQETFVQLHQDEAIAGQKGGK